MPYITFLLVKTAVDNVRDKLQKNLNRISEDLRCHYPPRTHCPTGDLEWTEKLKSLWAFTACDMASTLSSGPRVLVYLSAKTFKENVRSLPTMMCPELTMQVWQTY